MRDFVVGVRQLEANVCGLVVGRSYRAESIVLDQTERLTLRMRIVQARRTQFVTVITLTTIILNVILIIMTVTLATVNVIAVLAVLADSLKWLLNMVHVFC